MAVMRTGRMKLLVALLACGIAVAAATTSAAVTASIESFAYETRYVSPQRDLSASWQLTADNTALNVEVRAKTDGWLSFAVGPAESMIGLDAFVAFVNGTDLIYYDGYCDDIRMAPRDEALGGHDNVRDVSYVSLNDLDGNPILIVQFTRDLAAHDEFDVAIGDSILYFALAKGPLRRGAPRKHDSFAIVAMNMMSGIVSYSHATLRPLHATFMLISWGFFIPCGILVARFFKVIPAWFWAHIGLQVTGLAFMIAGLVVILVSLGGAYYSTAHAALGVAVVAAGLFQLIIGVLGSFFGVAPRLADAAHRHFGHVVMAAAAAQLVLGVWRLQDVHALYWLLGAWAAALLIAVVALTLREHANKDRPLDSASRSASGEIILQQLAELGDKEAIASQQQQKNELRQARPDSVAHAIMGVWVIAAIALVAALIALCFVWSGHSPL